MDFFQNIISPNELRRFFKKPNFSSIDFGLTVRPKTQSLSQVLSLWCLRIDRLIALDFEVNGTSSMYKSVLENYRGFTFMEYLDLHNPRITEEEFCHYPIFGQLDKENGGIRTEKQRFRYTSKYAPDENDYFYCLKESGLDKLLDFFFQDSKISLPVSEIQKHVSMIAPTSAGKTVFLEYILFNLTLECQCSSFVVIDPHGGLSRNAKKFQHLKTRTVYIDPFLNDGFTPCFNPLSTSDRSEKNLSITVDMLIKAFEEVLNREGSDITESMVNMLEKAIYFLLRERKDASLVLLVDLLAGDEKLAIEASAYDPIFDLNVFLRPNNKTRNGLLNRIGRILNSPSLKNLLGGESTFNLEELLNSNKVLIFNLSSLGEIAQVAFGRFLMANIRSIIRKRNKPSDHHTYCFIDEVHNFVGGKSESFEYILSQLRGYGLHMIMANQYPEQLGASLKAVVQNTAIKLLVEGSSYDLFSVSPNKAKLGLFEFLLKVRNMPPQIIKSPSCMLDNPDSFYINASQEKLLDDYLIEKYYKPHEIRKYEPVNKPKLEEDFDVSSFNYNIYINQNDS